MITATNEPREPQIKIPIGFRIRPDIPDPRYWAPLGSLSTAGAYDLGYEEYPGSPWNTFIYPKRVLNRIIPTVMAHLHAKDDSDVTAFSLSYDSDKYLLDVSPTTSEFPEIPNTTVPIAEHNKPSPRRREDTLDPSKPPSVIPQIDPDPKKRRRTLVLCFDGTGDQFDADNSNIVKLVSLLKKDDSANQLVYYQVRFFKIFQLRVVEVALCIFLKAGIGTYDTDSNSTALMSAIRKVILRRASIVLT